MAHIHESNRSASDVPADDQRTSAGLFQHPLAYVLGLQG